MDGKPKCHYGNTNTNMNEQNDQQQHHQQQSPQHEKKLEYLFQFNRTCLFCCYCCCCCCVCVSRVWSESCLLWHTHKCQSWTDDGKTHQAIRCKEFHKQICISTNRFVFVIACPNFIVFHLFCSQLTGHFWHTKGQSIYSKNVCAFTLWYVDKSERSWVRQNV